MRFPKISIFFALTALAAVSQAQFSQPWTPNAKGFTSRIPNCSTPFGPPGMAVDDFVSASTSNLTILAWWCNVSAPAQLNRPVNVSVYPNLPGACFPDFTNSIYSQCVVPAIKQLVGTDCLGRRVYRCIALLPAGGVTVTPGAQYWLQISEDDSNSLTPGVDDFKWCGHFGNVGCPAFQIAPTGVVNSPLLGCGAVNDLAFRIA